MLLKMADWHRIREQFTDAEKDAINAAITGEVICPRGCTLSESLLTPALADKIKTAVKP